MSVRTPVEHLASGRLISFSICLKLWSIGLYDAENTKTLDGYDWQTKVFCGGAPGGCKLFRQGFSDSRLRSFQLIKSSTNPSSTRSREQQLEPLQTSHAGVNPWNRISTRASPELF